MFKYLQKRPFNVLSNIYIENTDLYSFLDLWVNCLVKRISDDHIFSDDIIVVRSCKYI